MKTPYGNITREDFEEAFAKISINKPPIIYMNARGKRMFEKAMEEHIKKEYIKYKLK